MPLVAQDDAHSGTSEEPLTDLGDISDVPPDDNLTDSVPLVAQGDYDDDGFIDAADLDNRKWRWEYRKQGKAGQNTYWLARTGRYYGPGHDTRETFYVGKDRADPHERARSHGVDVGGIG